MKKEIRVRIAPSPTGPLHIGTARTALFNYLFAKRNKGKFILRIEDTDLERSDKKFENDIIENLKWLGIIWDEGPDIGGPYAPYRQTQRISSYKKYLLQLLDKKMAYWCYCTEEEIAMRTDIKMAQGLAPKYECDCQTLDKNTLEEYKKAGRKPILRFKMPTKELSFNDLIRGKVSFDGNLIGDIAIAKNLETPLYNFAVVIDDFEMKISHVIRGEDHISNTPKQIAIQEALNLPRPEYAHLPLILGADRSKMSKRHGAISIEDYKNKGYLPQALVNFMALLGWSHPKEKEVLTIKELIDNFSLERIQKSGAIFNIEKLNWLNGHYIRNLKPEELVNLAIPFITQAGFKSDKNYAAKVIKLEQERLKKIGDLPIQADFFFKDKLEYDTNSLKWKHQNEQNVLEILQEIRKFLEKINEKEFHIKKIKTAFENLIKNKGTGEVLWPFRFALSGKKASPGPYEIAEVLGKIKTLERINYAIKILE